MSDHAHMARAIQLAKRGLYTTRPNPRVGCVLVKQGRIVGEGWHEYPGGPHAEVNALQAAGAEAEGATAYVSLEPCSHHGKTPPCADALIAARVSRVIAAMVDPNPRVAGRGLERLAQAGIEVESGLLESQAKALNPGFIKRMQQGLPWVRVKLAMSLDGRTAMASGDSKWITGESARLDVQRLRARSDAILTGIGTLLADDPSMNLRISAQQLGCRHEPAQPMRVVVDSRLQSPGDAAMFGLPGKTVIVTCAEPQGRFPDSVSIQPVAAVEGRVDLLQTLRWLAEQQVNEVHVEAGSRLSGALLEQELVDEVVIYMAPHLMGDNAKGLFHLPQLEQMKQRIGLDIQDIRAVGGDWRISAIPRSRYIEE